ncbi:Transcription factor prr1 [Vanrija pseudolonga]|uniref:Transcription factor prr1 n=1 Tax=Vanrija pseudolonga TaxID=143232 RepID=A0AAF0Y684_9TREE|nr:Transcription factor prr1 [Vanrija pseudolonga]
MQHLGGFQQPSGLPLTSPPLVSSSATVPSAAAKLQQGTWGPTPQPHPLSTSYSKPLALGPSFGGLTAEHHPYQHQHQNSSNQLGPPATMSFQTPRGFPQANEHMYYSGHTQSITPRFAGYDAGVSAYSQPLLPAQGNLAPQQQEDDRWYSQPPDPTRSPTKRGKGQKKADGKQATFLTKLYNILEQPEYNHIIRWDQTGETIIIERPEELADKILPIVYRQSRFASFSRQLNIYGWMRKVSLRNVENGIVDPDASMWSHKSLRRDSPKDLILTFKRRVPPRPTQAQKNARLQNEIQLLSSDSDGFNSPAADAYSNYRLNDLDGRPLSNVTLDNPHLVPAGAGSIGMHHQTGVPRGETSPKVVPRPFAVPSTAPATAIPIHRGHSLHFMVPAARATVHSAPATSTSFSGVSSSFTFPGTQGGKFGTDPLPKPVLPTSARFAPTWMGGGDVRLDNADPLLRGTTDDPTYRIDDGTTWARRGQGVLGEGMKPTSSASLYPSSLPSSINYNPSLAQEPLREPLPSGSSSFSEFGKAMSPNNQPTTSSHGSPVQAGAVTELQAQTISPGVYSSRAFGNAAPPAPQANITTRSWPPRGVGGSNAGSGTPPPPRSPTIIKHERRHSSSKAPYTPPNSTREVNTQTSTTGPGGPVRHTHTKRSSLSQVNTTLPLPRDEEALPSANLPGQPELFGELDRPVEVVEGL